MLPDHIVITTQPGKDLQHFLSQKNYISLAVLLDENTAAHCYPKIRDFIPTHSVIQVKSGEEQKTISTCSHIWQEMTVAEMDRHAALIIIGGGVLCDMGGFCAATYKRGIDFIFIPTTLLAQADASIGGKLGIDFNDFKNQVGVFKEPVLNLLNPGFLKTLPDNELRSGFAEVIKHALISNEDLWDKLRTQDITNQPWEALLKQSAEFKYAVVRQDPNEKGLRKILNAGHTIGHAIETYCLTNGNRVLHGEAVAAGLIAEAKLAVNRHWLDEPSLAEITHYILKTFGKIELPETELKKIAALCSQDKKNKGNKVLAVLPEGIGKAQWDVEVSLEEIEACLSFYRLL
jgi:3-dehydroquinate synthase